MITDLRALACALAMRGEIEGSLHLVECLREIGGLSTSVGQCVVRGKIKNGSDLQDILAVIKIFHDTKSDDQVQVCMYIMCFIKGMNVFYELINWLKDVACDMLVDI